MQARLKISTRASRQCPDPPALKKWFRLCSDYALGVLAGSGRKIIHRWRRGGQARNGCGPSETKGETPDSHSLANEMMIPRGK